MKELHISTPIISANYDELNDEDRRLVDAARRMTLTSYAPYSHFHVGAAVRLDNGEIVTGSNQENAAYPSGICAERTASFYAHARYPEAAFEALAIAARETDGKEIKNPISPCGGCRQVLLEYERLAGHDVKVILAGSSECYILPSVKSLMPLAFTEFE
jgi:cytidine deaminase